VSSAAITLILVAAVAHASWNLFSKQAAATGAVFFTWLVAASATVLYAPVIAVLAAVQRPHLAAINWIFMAGTGILQGGYFLFLQAGYKIGDLSVVYPVGRGTGALLAALGGILVLGEHLRPAAIAGIGCVVAGIVVIGLPGRQASQVSAGQDSAGQVSAGQVSAGQDQGQPGGRAPIGAGRAIALAVTTGIFIAAYTLWDKHAVTTLRTPPLLQGYACFPVMLLAFAPLVLRDRPRLAAVWASFRAQAIGAGVLAPLAYALVLVALSFTAVAVVAPAREVSVLFGVLLGRRLLGEGSTMRRLAAATAIVAGVVALAVG